MGEICKYEYRKKHQIRKRLENKFKSEKTKNYKLLKKNENLKSSRTPSNSVLCLFCKHDCRVTVKNLDNHFAKVHGNIPAAERERLSVFQCDICGSEIQHRKLEAHIRQ